MKLPLSMRIVNIVGCLMFAVFAWVQHNDHDPGVYHEASGFDAWMWLMFHASIAVLLGLGLFRPISVWLLVLVGAACCLELARTAPGMWENVFGGREFVLTQAGMSAADPRVELSREFLGALIASSVVGILCWERRFFGKRGEGRGSPDLVNDRAG